MPITRSSTRSASGVAASVKIASPPPVAQKRKLSQAKDSKKRPKTTFSPATATGQASDEGFSTAVSTTDPNQSPQLVPAVLTFSFEEAKKHLISVDPRFEDLFSKMKCKPFEQLEQVHPFRYIEILTNDD